MKFAYVDESGSKDMGDVFVMAGLLIDAYRLRKHTDAFDRLITEFLAKHPGAGGARELKTAALINGIGGWSKVDALERKAFLKKICDLAAVCATIFAVAFSFKRFDAAANAGHEQTFGTSYWLGAAMFVASLVQQKMQKVKKNKGLTVFICDDNKREMQNFSDALYEAPLWFDPIYEFSPTPGAQRFNRIINSAFAKTAPRIRYFPIRRPTNVNGSTYSPRL